MSDAISDIVNGFQQEMSAPVRGEVIVRIMQEIGFASVAEVFLEKAAEKLQLTRTDGEIHDFMLLLPDSPLTVAVRCFVYPGPLRDGAVAARDDLYQTAAHVASTAAIAGIFHMAVFAGKDPIELTLAWLPFADRNLDDGDLRSPVIPWRSDATVETKEPPPDGQRLVDLAKATEKMVKAMQQMIAIWPEEDGPVVRLGLPEGREALQAAIAAFNAAADRGRLAHRMPVSVFDATWLPHNLRNTLEFQSVPATLSAELRRTWGPEAAQGFRDALDIFLRGEGHDSRLEEIAAMGGPAVENAMESAVPPPRLDVFVCYTWADKTRGARDVYEFVMRQGLTAWLDEEQRPVDAALDAQIAKALQTAGVIVGCFSREMVTRGGYALRELLFVLSLAPERLILARLDKTPIPLSLVGVSTVDWFRKDGPEQLRTRLTSIAERSVTPETLSLAIPEGALTESLLSLVRRPAMPPRSFVDKSRGAQLKIRAALLEAVLDVFELYESGEWDAICERIGELRQAQQWPTLSSTLVQEEPTLIGPIVRLRFSLFTAEVQLVNTDDWCAHNRAAIDILEELLAVNPAQLNPAPELGWLVDDSRVALRDCLDAFANAEEWFRGWSPEMLADMCKIPRDAVMTIQERMANRVAILADRMFALRIMEDRTSSDFPSSSLWTSLRETLLHKLDSSAGRLTTTYAELRSVISNEAIARVAVAVADGIVEAFRLGASQREELIEDHNAIRVRFVIRSYRSGPSKIASLELARGTVLDDLMNHSQTTDLTVLVSTFVPPRADGDDWKFEVNLNVMPHPRPDSAAQLARLGPLLMPQMLSDEEQVQIQHLLQGRVVYEEV